MKERAAPLSLAIASLVACAGAEASAQEPAETEDVVQVTANRATVELVGTWDEDIWLFTSAEDPVRSLEGLTREDVAAWGAEHLDRMKRFFEVAGIEGEILLRVVGTGSYADEKPALFVTWATFASELIDQGAVRVELVPAAGEQGREKEGI